MPIQARSLQPVFQKLAFLVLLLVLGAPAARAAPFAYIPNTNSNTLSVIDTATNTVTATVVVNEQPYDVAVNPQGTRVYVSHTLSTLVSVVDTASNSLIATVDVGPDPGGIAVTPDGSRVYVAGRSLVSEIDAATNKVISTFGAGGAGAGMAVNPAGTRLYFANGPFLRVIDLNTKAIVASVAVPGGGVGVAVNLLGTRVYVANQYPASVLVIDTATNAVIANMPVAAVGGAGEYGLAYGIAVSPDSTRVYVAVWQVPASPTVGTHGNVAVIDANTNTDIATVQMPGLVEPGQGLSVNPTGTAVYVLGEDGNVGFLSPSPVLVLNTACNEVSTAITVGTYHLGLGNFIAPATVPLPPPGPPATSNLRITGMEVTQGIQDTANSVPLVSGRRTFVRVYVQSDGPVVPGVTATLTGLGFVCANPTCGQVGTQLGPLIPANTVGPRITVRADPKRINLNDSFLFELPWSWTNLKFLKLHAVLSTDTGPPKMSCASDLLSEPSHEFQPPTRLLLQFMRMSYRLPGVFNGINDQLVQATVAEQNLSESVIRRTYPLSNLISAPDLPLYDAGLGDRVARTAFECTFLPADQLNLCAHNYVANRLAALQASSGPFGNLPGPPGSGYIGISDALYALIPPVPNDTNGQYFTRGACCTDRVGAGPSDLGDYAAHEIGHFLGRRHPVEGAALCGHSADDSGYPYFISLIAPPLADPKTSLAGFDGGDAALKIPMSHRAASSLDSTKPINNFDTMGYCKPSWISDYTYNNLYICLASLHSDLPGFTPGCPSASAAGAGGTSKGDWLTVFGNIDPSGARADFISRRVDHLFSIPPPASGIYSIQLTGAGGATLAAYPFTASAVPDSGASLRFGQVVPFIVGTHAIRIIDTSKANLVLGEKAVSANPPTIGTVALQGSAPVRGVVTIGWTASDADGDPLTFDILFTRDQGASLQPLMVGVSGSSAQIDTAALGGGSGQFRVVASDGVHTASADTAPVTLENKPPVPHIVTPGDGQSIHVGQLLNMEGAATDAQDGILPDTALAWSMSGRPLGSGSRLSVADLAVGMHTITFTATNSVGLSANSTVSVTVQESPTRPGPTLTAGPALIGWHVAVGESRPQTANLEIGNSGSGTLAFTAQSSATWLTLDVSSGVAPATLTLSANPSGFSGGMTETATVTLTASGISGQVMTVPVTLSIGNTFVVGRTSAGALNNVPNVVGLTQAAAAALLASSGLKVGTVIGQSSAMVPTGNVISESPAAGTHAAAGSLVNLVVSAGALKGDLNGDGAVNCTDLNVVKASFGKKAGQSGFDSRADLNGDGVVNIVDLSMEARLMPTGTACN
jgi:YVTN family beta-propeller protein